MTVVRNINIGRSVDDNVSIISVGVGGLPEVGRG